MPIFPRETPRGRPRTGLSFREVRAGLRGSACPTLSTRSPPCFAHRPGRSSRPLACSLPLAPARVPRSPPAPLSGVRRRQRRPHAARGLLRHRRRRATPGSVRQLAVAPERRPLRGHLGQRRSAAACAPFATRDGDGKPDERASFGPRGGNDVELHDGYLYLALNDRIVRWRLTPGQARARRARRRRSSPACPTTAITQAKSIAFGGGDTMFVSIGSATNSCQQTDRAAEVARASIPAPSSRRRAGIWQFSAEQAGPDASRTASASPPACGTRSRSTIRARHRRAVRRHPRPRPAGRQLGLQRRAATRRIPPRSWCRCDQGDDFGWPYCYYSIENKARCSLPSTAATARRSAAAPRRRTPSIAFPAHWAPLALAFYPGRRSARSTRTDSSSRSTGPGTARRCRRRATGWCSRRSRTGSRPGSTRPSPREQAVRPSSGRAGWRWAPDGVAVHQRRSEREDLEGGEARGERRGRRSAEQGSRLA